MDKLTFSTDWNNKLQCSYFTTLRLTNHFEVGKKYEIHLKDVQIGFGRIISKKLIYFHQINEYISYLDTGYSPDKCKALLREIHKNRCPKVEWKTQPIFFYLVQLKKQAELFN